MAHNTEELALRRSLLARSARAVAASCILAWLLLPACSEGPQAGDTLYPASGPVNFEGEIDAEGERTVVLELGLRSFAPTFIYGGSGQPLELVLRNDTDVDHTFAILRYGVLNTERTRRLGLEVPARSSVSAHVIFGDSANRIFYCEYHWAEGMVGELVRFWPSPQDAPP